MESQSFELETQQQQQQQQQQQEQPLQVLHDSLLVTGDDLREVIRSGTQDVASGHDALPLTDVSVVDDVLKEYMVRQPVPPETFLAPVIVPPPEESSTSTFTVFRVRPEKIASDQHVLVLCRSSFIRNISDARHSVARHAEETQRVASLTNPNHSLSYTQEQFGYSIHIAPVIASLVRAVPLGGGQHALVQHMYLRLADCTLADWIKAQMTLVMRMGPPTTSEETGLPFDDMRPEMMRVLFLCVAQFMTQALLGVRAAYVGPGIIHRGLHAKHVLLRPMTDNEAQFHFLQYGVQASRDGPTHQLTLPTRIEIFDQYIPLPIAEVTDFRHSIGPRDEEFYYTAYSKEESSQELVDSLRERLGQAFDPIMLSSSVQRVVEEVFMAESLTYDSALPLLDAPVSASKGRTPVPKSTWFRHTLRLMSNNYTITEVHGEEECELILDHHPATAIDAALTGAQLVFRASKWNAAHALTSFLSVEELSAVGKVTLGGDGTYNEALGGYVALRRKMKEWLEEQYDPYRSHQKGQAHQHVSEHALVYAFAPMPWQWDRTKGVRGSLHAPSTLEIEELANAAENENEDAEEGEVSEEAGAQDLAEVF